MPSRPATNNSVRMKLTSTLHPRGPAGAFVLTDDEVAELGAGRKAFPVSVIVNDVTLPLRLARMGGENMTTSGSSSLMTQGLWYLAWTRDPTLIFERPPQMLPG